MTAKKATAKQDIALNSDMMQKCVVLVVSLGKMGNTRKISVSSVVEKDKGIDYSMLRTGKKLLDCEEFDAIDSLDGEIRSYIYSVTTPNPILRGGTYLLSLKLLEECHAKLSEFLLKRNALVDKFLEVYQQRVDEAKQRLGPAFNVTDYQSRATVRAQFTFDWDYMQFGVAASLEGVNAEMYEAAKQKAAAKLDNAVDEVRTALRAGMAELVDHLVDRLSGDEDGKPKVFRNSMLDNVRDFLKTFEGRNIVDDKELSKLVQRASDLVDGIDPDTLRKSKVVRETVQGGFAEIKTKLDTMLVNRPKRAISFGDAA